MIRGVDRVFTIGGAHAIGRRVPVPRLIHVRAHPIGHRKIFSGLQAHVFELCSRAGLKEITHVQEHPGTDRRLGPVREGGTMCGRARAVHGSSDHRVPRGAGLHVRRLRRGTYLRGFERPADYEARAEKVAQTHLGKIRKLAEAAGIRCEGHYAKSDFPADAILQAVERYRCDSIFMGSHGRSGVSKLLLGSQTQKVLAAANVPVVVIR